MKNPDQANQFFNDKIKKIASKVNPESEHLETLEKLQKFEKSLTSRLSRFETIFLKASPKLKTIILHNPHLQAVLMEAKPSMWISFEEMFPGDLDTWLYLLKVKNLFFEKSLNIIFNELYQLKPSLIKLREDFIVDTNQIKEIISQNLDIFAELRDTPYIAITNEETKTILEKMAKKIESGQIANISNILGLILGYPRKQVLLHRIIEKLDIQFLIPKLNDFSRYGFLKQTLQKESITNRQEKLIDIFTNLEQWENQMNNEATSFEEQTRIHKLINKYLNEHKTFLRMLVFKHYFLNGISQIAADAIDNYILLSFPRLAFPESLDFNNYGMYWIEYQPERESDYIKAKILLAVRKIKSWQDNLQIKS